MIRNTLLPAAAALALLMGSQLACAQDNDAAPQATPKVHKEWKEPGEHGGWELSPEKRKMIHEAMESLHQKNEAVWEKKFNLHEDIRALMKAQQFDAQAYLDKKGQLDALQDTLRKNKEETFANLASKLTPHERMMLVFMEHHGHGGHKHGFAS